MSYRSKLLITVVLLLVLTSIGVANYYFSDDEMAMLSPGTEEQASSSPAVGSTTSQATNGGVSKQGGVNVEEIITANGLEAKESSDPSMIGQVVGTALPISTHSILKDGDRAGAIIWIQSPDSKMYFFSLKDALLAAFTPAIQDLRDEILTEPGMPIRNILTFSDTGLSEERLTFVRVRERLYEFHTVTGKESVMEPLIEAITTT